MTGDKLTTNVLAVKIVPNVSRALAARLAVPEHHFSVGFLTTDCDDVGYAAIDEATKKADVRVAYAKSFYAGAKSASQKYAGEFIGVLSGPSPEAVRSGLNAAISFIENDACFYSANEDDSVAYFAQCIARTGSYLSREAGIPEGQAIGYLIAPPLEATYALDAALKAAEVELAAYFPPPSETNFSGGYVTGSQAACKAACEAFAEAVVFCAGNPAERGCGGAGEARFGLAGSAKVESAAIAKPEHMTHLREGMLVPKTHPRIALRGQLDSLQAAILLAQAELARDARHARLIEQLEDVLGYVRVLLRCEVLEQPVPSQRLLGLSEAELRERSHDPQRFYGVPRMLLPHHGMGLAYLRLNALRCAAREAELAAMRAFAAEGWAANADFLRAMNRLSSALHILMCEWA